MNEFIASHKEKSPLPVQSDNGVFSAHNECSEDTLLLHKFFVLTLLCSLFVEDTTFATLILPKGLDFFDVQNYNNGRKSYTF